MRVDGHSTRLTQYTGGTPAASTSANQFAISGTTLYVNLNGANPNSYTSTYAWKRTYGNLVLLGRMFSNRWNRAAAYHEGHGLAADDWADSNFLIGNRVYDNEGLGLSNNRGASNCWYGNVVEDNWMAGIAVNPADGVRVINNTVRGNNSGEGASAYTAPIQLNAGCSNAVISNNIIDCLSRDTYGINVNPTDSGHGGANNLVDGTGTAARSGTFTGTQQFDVADYLNEDGSLKTTIDIGGIPMPNPLRNMGTYAQGVTLRNGRTQPGMTPIGANQVGRY
jgi:parallel beta-helix repeat protein